MSTTAPPPDPIVRWHDLECGRYAADLPLWAELAAAAGGPVLDIGAGTGRVSLHLAAAGHEVDAVDLEPRLLAALAARAADRGLAVRTSVADARSLALDRRFALVLAPMQTVQLLGGADGRRRFLRAARSHLAPGSRLACALAHPLEGLEHEAGEPSAPPRPDVLVAPDATLVSRALAVREEPNAWVIERLRETWERDGSRTVEEDRVRLDRVDAAGLEAEARAVGLRAVGRRRVDPTAEHVGSEVVVLDAG